MIRYGENPDGEEAINKFVLPPRYENEGHRGQVVALRDDGKEAILHVLTRSEACPFVEPGVLVLVREEDPDCYPVFQGTWTGLLPVDGWTFYARTDIRPVEPPSLWQRFLALFA